MIYNFCSDNFFFFTEAVNILKFVYQRKKINTLYLVLRAITTTLVTNVTVVTLVSRLALLLWLLCLSLIFLAPKLSVFLWPLRLHLLLSFPCPLTAMVTGTHQMCIAYGRFLPCSRWRSCSCNGSLLMSQILGRRLNGQTPPAYILLTHSTHLFFSLLKKLFCLK
jgi:hypothetical protein